MAEEVRSLLMSDQIKTLAATSPPPLLPRVERYLSLAPAVRSRYRASITSSSPIPAHTTLLHRINTILVVAVEVRPTETLSAAIAALHPRHLTMPFTIVS